MREDSWPHRFIMLFAAISKEIFQYTRRLPLCIAITVATKCSDLWAVCLVFLSFGYTVAFALAATAKCALAIVSFIPITPLATGLPHLTQAGLMNHVAGIPGEALAAAGISPEYLGVAKDPSWDEVVRAETAIALERTGPDVGTPILTYGAPDGPTYFGPVISRLPGLDDALRLWDAMVTLGQIDVQVTVGRDKPVRHRGGNAQ